MGFMLRKPPGEAGASAPAIVIGLFVAFGGILFGYVRCRFVSVECRPN